SSPSLLVQVVKGWHARPGKETVGDQPGLTGRSVTLWNGACRVLPRSVDKHLSDLGAQPESDRTAGVADRSHRLRRAGGPQPGAPSQSHWAIWRAMVWSRVVNAE